MESRFADGRYLGYEVRLRVERNVVAPYRVARAADVYRLLRPLGAESAEHVYSVHLDGGHRVVGVYLVGKGSCTRAPADPMEVFKAALLLNAPSLVLAHNHPSGDATPSPQDCAMAKRLVAGARLLGLRFLDSIIITDGYLSMAEEGHLFEAGLEARSRW